MGILGERERIEIGKIIAGLPNPVKLINFTQTFECESCHDTHGLLQELAELSDKISLEVFNFSTDKEKVEQYRIDKIPATVVEGQRDYGIRFYGPPEGYEFAMLLDTIGLISRGESALSPDSKAKLSMLEEPMHLEVLVTPT